MASGPPLIGIAGWKNSGKTTLVERLVMELSRRGLRIATIKHTHHELRAPDGMTDGERHARAGAVSVAVVGPAQWELGGERQSGPAPALEELAKRLGPADLVLVEGCKRAPIPKVEVRRLASQTREPLAGNDPHVIAIATDHGVEAGATPVLALDHIEAIADLIVKTAGLNAR